MEDKSSTESGVEEKPSVTLPGFVEKVVKPVFPTEPEKAQIVVEGADPLYREIRIENTLTNESGEAVRLKEGAPVEVTIEAEPAAVVAEDDESK